MTRFPRPRRWWPLLLLGTTACLLPAEYAAEADRSVYAIVQERRDQLAAGGDFTIDPPADSLRQRLQAGQTLQDLSLEELLVAAAENSREYRTRRENLYLAALDLTLERWRYGIQPAAGASASVGGADGVGGGESFSAGVLSSVGFTKLLGSGAEVAGDIGLDLFRDISQGDGWDALSNLSLSISQPLLRGFGSRVVYEPLTQAERNVLYEARTYERFRRTFAYDVLVRYFNILRQLDNLGNQRENARSLARLRERNEAFAEAGQLNEIQVDQARQDELRARNQVIDSERNLQTSLDDFKLILGLPVDTPLGLRADDSLDPARWRLDGLDPPLQLVVDTALQRRFDHLNVLERVQDAERKVYVAADALRAGLGVGLSGGASSAEGRPLDYGPDTGRDWRLSLDLDLPVNNLPERNAYRERLIQLERARRDAQESADVITADLRDALRSLYAARQSYEIQANAVELADRRVESTELSLEAGRASTRDVLESKEDLLSAQISRTSALIEYILSALAVYRDMELLTVTEQGVDVDFQALADLGADAEDPAAAGAAETPEEAP